MVKDMRQETAKLIVTSAGLERARHIRLALNAAVPTARIRRTGLKGIVSLEAEGDVFELAKLLFRKCSQRIGHVLGPLTAVGISRTAWREQLDAA
jgi:hypothetical protein